MFRVVKVGRYVIVHAICHVSLNVRIKRGKKKRITLRAWAACVYTGFITPSYYCKHAWVAVLKK